MTINDIINGPEGAKNSSKQQNAGIQTPENGSYEQTLLVGAISKSLGYEGLHSPVSQNLNGTAYTFDFYHPENERLLKVFKGFEGQAFRLYADHPDKPILIFESKDLPCKMETCECGCGSVLVVEKKAAERLCDNPYVLIHADGNLWQYGMRLDGKWIWKKRTPFLIRELMEDCEEDEDED